jgi:PAS domain S-box-containing protein
LNSEPTPPALAEAGLPAEDPDLLGRLLDEAGIGMWTTDHNWRLVQANEALAAMCGYPSPAVMVAEVRGREKERFADQDVRAEMYRELVEGRPVRGFVVRYRRRDGSLFWARVTAATIAGRNGTPQWFTGTVIDVDEAIRTREALRAAELSYRDIFENAAEGIYRSNPEGRQLRANPALVRLNGYESESQMLEAVRDIAREWYVEPTRRDTFKQLLHQHGRIAAFESEVYRHRTRERIWITENAWLVRDMNGQPLYYEGTVQDITERKRAESAMHLSEARFRDYAQTASDWFWETDPDHRFTLLSSSDRLSPRRSEAMIGKRRIDVVAATGEEVNEWRRHMQQLDARLPFRDFIYRIIADDGSSQYIATSGKPIFDAAGEFTGYRGSARLVTETILAESRLRDAKLAAEAASAAKSAFLATMSHELRTPLNAIIGFAELTLNQTMGPVGERYIDYAANIVESGRHLLQLVNDVLDMSKILSGSMGLDTERVRLADICRRHASLHAAKAEEAGIGQVLSVDAELPPVLVDPLRLGQVLSNLIANAIKFTPRGGKVEISTGREADGRIAILVADTGIGMSEEEIQLAFEPFRQVDATRSRRFEGTGLGLPISKSLVELHGGELQIQSVKGAGTTVAVRLPAERLLS